MNLPKRILMATDFSEFGDRAAGVAMDFAAAVGATLDWTHAVEVSIESQPLFSTGPVSSPVDQASKLSALKLEDLKNHAIERGLRSDSRGLRGSPAAAIVAHAAELEADLIVVGSHGHTGIRHALIGSVAERIVREAGCSVLVVKGDRPLFEGLPLVLGEDLSPSTSIARDIATSLAETLDLPLHIVHAIDAGIPYLSTLEIVLPTELVGNLYAEAKEQLESIARESPSVRIANEEISSEHPSDAICAAARKVDASLIVVGSHGRRGVERILLGSTAEKVVRHAPCSIFVAR